MLGLCLGHSAFCFELTVLRPSGGSPAPADNPPRIEAMVTGGILHARSFRTTIDGIETELNPARDGFDNDGDGLIDEDGEQLVSWPGPDVTKFAAIWPWALQADDPATRHINEGLHVLQLEVSLPESGALSAVVDFAILSRGGIDSLIVFPSPFDPGEEMARVAYRVLTPGETRVEILDFQGETIATVSSWNQRSPGWSQDPVDVWDGKNNNGDIVANGVYFIRVEFRDGSLSDECIEKCLLSH